MLNRRVDIFPLVPSLRGIASVLTLNYDINHRFFIDALYQFEDVLFYSLSSEGFYHD